MHMRRSHRVMAALALSSIALVACNLLTGLDKDYSSIATAPVSEAGGSDGSGSDGPRMDGSMTDVMVTPDGDAGPSTWCQARQDQSGASPANFFCADFEGASFPPGGGSPPKGWSSFDNNLDAGTLSFVEVDASLALDVTAASSGMGGAHTRLVKDMTVTGAHQYLHYDLQYDFCVVESTLPYGAVGLLTFANFSVETKEHGIATYGPASPGILSQQGGMGALGKPFPNDRGWHHAKITLDRMQADALYARKITIDTTDVDGDVATHAVADGEPTFVAVGAFNSTSNAGGAHIQFDNIVFFRK